ncbi:hypothetical protein B0H17DRAFT_1133740 [Mycena rosella]|uniref:Uncharacterized protein n=1 Tax=Mycena rosella TaxID=1033263 RepID=A0AAD7DH54_MYCRO|nr:hypothetical protein B0H17DRAFT_1133740 [Mycena rosella]
MALDKGIIAARMIEELSDRDTFIDFLRNDLLPVMNPYPGPNSILLLDNVRIQHSEEIWDLIDSFGFFCYQMLSSTDRYWSLPTVRRLSITSVSTRFPPPACLSITNLTTLTNLHVLIQIIVGHMCEKVWTRKFQNIKTHGGRRVGCKGMMELLSFQEEVENCCADGLLRLQRRAVREAISSTRSSVGVSGGQNIFVSSTGGGFMVSTPGFFESYRNHLALARSPTS